MDVIKMIAFFFNDTATTEIYTLSLHDALPILDLNSDRQRPESPHRARVDPQELGDIGREVHLLAVHREDDIRSEEHTSELQSRQYLVCRLLLEKKKQHTAAMSRIFLLT